jgi:hypothetical protein
VEGKMSEPRKKCIRCGREANSERGILCLECLAEVATAK